MTSSAGNAEVVAIGKKLSKLWRHVYGGLIEQLFRGEVDAAAASDVVGFEDQSADGRSADSVVPMANIQADVDRAGHAVAHVRQHFAAANDSG